MACRWAGSPGSSASGGTWFGRGATALGSMDAPACRIGRGQVGRGRCPPAVVLHLVARAGALPEQAGRSLSQWDGAERARQLVRDAVVMAIAPQTVPRLLAGHRLKPWRQHVWRHPRTPRDAAFAEHVRAVAARLTRPLAEYEVVLRLDELTSLQPRPRRVATRPAQPGRAVPVEHAYRRAGATHRFAAFNTRSGQVDGETTRRKRPVAYLTLLAHRDRVIPASITTIHRRTDTVAVDHGRPVRQWLSDHPRGRAPCTPVHGSGMHRVEHWFGSRRRTRRRAPICADRAARQHAIRRFSDEWTVIDHPFRGTARSFETILATVEAPLAPTAAPLVDAASPLSHLRGAVLSG